MVHQIATAISANAKLNGYYNWRASETFQDGKRDAPGRNDASCVSTNPAFHKRTRGRLFIGFKVFESVKCSSTYQSKLFRVKRCCIAFVRLLQPQKLYYLNVTTEK